MTLEAAYMISQIAAVLLIVPSLLYLALQVRQNTAQARANASYQFLEASGHINMLLASDRDTASAMRRGLTNVDDLDEDDRFRFLMYVGQFFQVYSTMYDLHKEKMMPESQWHAVVKDIVTVMSTAGGQWAWGRFAEKGLTPEFVAFATELAAKEESYSITDI